MSKLRERYHQAVTDAALEPAVMNLTMWDLAMNYKDLIEDETMTYNSLEEVDRDIMLVRAFDTVCEYYFGKEAWQRVKEGL